MLRSNLVYQASSSTFYLYVFNFSLFSRIEGWNECITRILRIPWGFVIGAKLTIVQSRLSLVNKIQKVYRSQGVQIHNRHIEIIVLLAKATLRGHIGWLKGLKENVVLGGMIPAGTGFKGLVHRSRQHNNILLETKKKNLFGGEMRDIFFHHRELYDSCISNNLYDTSGRSFTGIEFNDS
ncbi:hypothetical protein ES288_D10G144200v1 [Gossypium darwinii]|uniref:DNA-directed RNA polymerase n=1 Tax=Gossypium darwinii TaxID=34276 RepID=A0A5D2AYP3_GOSDA|nr:hypothetical protein ES288_D10G144200v1 [Gossypium darwinii]